MNEYLGPGLSVLGIVVGGLIARWTKRTPEKKDPAEYQAKQIEILMEQVTSQTERLNGQDQKIDDLNAKVERLFSKVVSAKRHIVRLEDHILQGGRQPPSRPPDIAELFTD